MVPVTLATIETAFRAAFARDTCAADDLPFWSEQNRSRGHCGVAAMTLIDLLGGVLLLATVHRDGEQIGYHMWNRLAAVDIDLTVDQFVPGEVVGTPDVVVRPPGLYADQYALFRARVGRLLGVEVAAAED